MLMALGSFVFSIDDLLFNQLQRERAWRHPTSDRVGARPAGQFAGPGEDTISIGGLLAPGQIGRADALEDIARMGDAGEAYPLLDGDGYVYGAYVIERLSETKRFFLASGRALAVDFTISLKRMDDDEGETGAAGQAVRS